ncbi:metallophosphoesterase [Methanopyrus sp.]
MELYHEVVMFKDIAALADVHVGVEIELRKRGIRAVNRTKDRVEKLRKYLEVLDTSILVIVGDLKHNVPSASRIEFRGVPKIVDAAFEIVDEVIVVKGNHDGLVEELLRDQRGVRVVGTSGILIDGFYFLHGHAEPDHELLPRSNVLVFGHEHPVSDAVPGVSVKVLVELELDLDGLTRGEVSGRAPGFVLPAFDDLVGGTEVTSDDRLLLAHRRGAVIDESYLPILEAEPF